MAFWRSKKSQASASPAEGGEPAPEQRSTEQRSTERQSTAPAGGGGMGARLRTGLNKTRSVLNTDIRDLFKAEGRLVDEDFLKELFARLVRTDMGAGPAATIRDDVAKRFRGRVVQMEDVLKTIREQIREMLHQEKSDIRWADSPPTVILVVGVNGSGKTTSIGKLANYLHSEGRHVVLGAGDTFRAAAVEQLTVWAGRIGCEIVTGKPQADPASVAFQTVEQAVQTGADVAIIDTAGRLQTQKHLMSQLEKIRRVVGKRVEGAPHEVLLVLDATAGQNAISQARGFGEAAECSGIILAKLDGTAKGGVVIPILQQFDLPVKFVGVGEGISDLTRFDADSFSDALFDGNK